MTHPTKIEQAASIIRARHLNAQEAQEIGFDLSAEDLAAALRIAEIPDQHPRPGEAGAWAWGGYVQECATRPPGRRSRVFAG